MPGQDTRNSKARNEKNFTSPAFPGRCRGGVPVIPPPCLQNARSWYGHRQGGYIIPPRHFARGYARDRGEEGGRHHDRRGHRLPCGPRHRLRQPSQGGGGVQGQLVQGYNFRIQPPLRRDRTISPKADNNHTNGDR